MGPGSLISAMLEPCESRGQALLTVACFVFIAMAVFAGAYACFAYAQAARETIPQMNFDSAYDRSRSGLDETMYMFFALSAPLGLLSALLCVSGIVVGFRSLLSKSGED